MYWMDGTLLTHVTFNAVVFWLVLFTFLTFLVLVFSVYLLLQLLYWTSLMETPPLEELLFLLDELEDLGVSAEDTISDDRTAWFIPSLTSKPSSHTDSHGPQMTSTAHMVLLRESAFLHQKAGYAWSPMGIACAPRIEPASP